MIVFIANLHCITEYQEPKELRKNLTDAVALYLACGLDPNKSTIFLQTDVKEQGVRKLQKTIKTILEDEICNKILSNELKQSNVVEVSVKDKKIHLSVKNGK